MMADTTLADPLPIPRGRAITWGVVVACAAVCAPALLALAGGGWMAAQFGAAAPLHAWVAGLAGAMLAGVTVTVVLRSLNAVEPVFLGAWVGTTLVRLMGLGVLAVAPLGADGATAGALLGYTAALVCGSLVEVPAIWIGGLQRRAA